MKTRKKPDHYDVTMQGQGGYIVMELCTGEIIKMPSNVQAWTSMQGLKHMRRADVTIRHTDAPDVLTSGKIMKIWFEAFSNGPATFEKTN